MVDNLKSWGFVDDYEENKEFFDELVRFVYFELGEEYAGHITQEVCAQVLAELLPSLVVWLAIEEKKGFEHLAVGVVESLRYEMAYYIVSKYLVSIREIGDPLV